MAIARVRAESDDIEVVSPEKQLLAAVINRALMDLGVEVDKGPNARRAVHPREHVRSAYIFVFSKPIREMTGFEIICQALRIDPEPIREKVRAAFRARRAEKMELAKAA